jgi:hypothetical protein
LDELLIFLNEMLSDWLKKNPPRHYANTVGRGRNQFTFRHPTDERQIVRVSIPTDVTGIEVRGTGHWFDSGSWERHDIELDGAMLVVQYDYRSQIAGTQSR